ncbi:MAG TPA: hypothetical protein VG757_03755 [Devosia sp.]|nr:hypothetical protein [Devosia sp.]
MDERGKINWAPVLIVWVVVAAVFGIRTVLQYHDLPLIGGGDDAARIVTAKDLLNGQNWFDLVQHRDDAPFGTLMHWSRLIDAPIAALMAIFGPIFGLPVAADIAATIWPLLLLLPLLMLETAIARRLMPAVDLLPAAVLPVISLGIVDEFRPGRVDHHNAQIVLCLVALCAFIVARDKWRGALAAGLALATSLAIGLETLPFVVVAIALMSLYWVFEPERFRLPLIAFAGALFLGSVAHFFAATAPSRYFELSCDMLGTPYLLVLGTSALAMSLSALLATRIGNVLLRLAIIGAAGVAGVALWVALYPKCLGGPYVFVDPRIVAAMYGDIAEAQGIWRAIAVDPAGGIALTIAALAMLPLTAWLAWKTRGEQRIGWLTILAFLAFADMVMVTQMRGVKFAAAFAVPAGVYLISAARVFYLKRRDFAGIAALVGSWLLFASGAQAVLIGGPLAQVLPPIEAPTGLVAQTIIGSECLEPPYLDKLATLPPGIVMAPIRLGPLIMHLTPHSIVSAGFHRNNDGTLDVMAFYPGTDAERLAIIAKRHIDYVVSCGMSLEGSYLEPLSLPGEALQIYRVRPA